MKTLGQFARNQSGVTSIEYAFIAMLVGVAVIVGAGTLGTNLGGALLSLNGMIPTP